MLPKAYSDRFLNIRIICTQSSGSRDCLSLLVLLWIPATDWGCGKVSKATFNTKVLLAHILINFK